MRRNLCVSLAAFACAASIAFGESAPGIRLTDVDGGPFDLDPARSGNVILIDFWATYCLPCLSELDAFKGMQERQGAKGFQVLAVSVDQPQTLARVRALAKGRHLPFPVLTDPGQDAYRAYGVSALPTSILIDRKGNIAWRQEGFRPGEEGRMEERIMALLADTDSAGSSPAVPAPVAPTAASPSAVAPAGPLAGLSLSGSNFLRAEYGREDRSQPEANGSLEDWFDARLANGSLEYRLRYRAYQFLEALPGNGNTLIRDPNHRVVKQSFTYAGEHADLRAGNVYGSVARGLLFRFFEDRQARLDKDLNGAWATLRGGGGAFPGRGRVSVFGGKTFSRFPNVHTVDGDEDAYRDLYLQGSEGSWEPMPGLGAGAQYAEAFREGWNARLAGGNLEAARGPVSAWLGYMDVTGEDRFNYPHAWDGRALYATASANLGRLDAGLEYKYYRNYDIGFAEPPSLVPLHTFRLMARDMLFPNNQAEDGFQARAGWHFPGGVEYAANAARLVSHPERNPALLIHHVELPFLDVDNQLRLPLERGSLLLDCDWLSQRRFAEGEFEDADALSLGATWERPAGTWNLAAEAEGQYRNVEFRATLPGEPAAGRLGSVGARTDGDEAWQGVLSATLGRASLWSLTLDYEATTSSRKADPDSPSWALGGLSNGWASAYLTWEGLAGHRISLWAGQRQERVVCSGGSCRLEPAFEGGELIWSSHF